MPLRFLPKRERPELEMFNLYAASLKLRGKNLNENEILTKETAEIETIRYEDSAVDERIKRAVRELGFEAMTPIQSQAIPVMIEGKDILGQAQTGTGKTAAFSIPILMTVDPENPALQAVVLCPTRELAIQAAEEMRKYAKYMHGIKVLPVYGGQDIMKQIRSLKSNVQVVVGTPGRVMDHLRRHTMKMGEVKTIVLDEADEMLDMGFREDIETVLEALPEEHQTALFSATMPKPILEITNKYQKENAVHLKMPAKELTIPLVKQYYYEVAKKNKEEVVARLMDYYNPKRSLIFCNTKKMVDELTENLVGRGYFAAGLHGDLSQVQRDHVMQGFRNGSVEILIATDVAARGIDVSGVEAVFNYDVPQDIEYYVHRIGRTGRAGKKGRSFTLVVGREIYKIRDIEKVCKTKMKARTVPTAADIRASKSEKILNKVLEIIEEQDLTDMLRIIESKIDDEDVTALDMAAAFLKQQMGNEILEDIPTEDYFAEKKKKKFKEREKRDKERRERERFDFGSRGRGERTEKGRRDDRKSARPDMKSDKRKDRVRSKDISKDGSLKKKKVKNMDWWERVLPDKKKKR